MIEILDSNTEFEYFENDIVKGKGICGTLLKTPQVSEWKQLIKFSLDNSSYVVDIFGRHEETVVVPVDWEFFTNEEVKELANEFHLRIKESEVLKMEGKKNYFRLIAVKDNLEYFLKLAIKKVDLDNTFILLLFYYEDGESRRSPVLFIDKISKVILSGELLKKISLLKMP